MTPSDPDHERIDAIIERVTVTVVAKPCHAVGGLDGGWLDRAISAGCERTCRFIRKGRNWSGGVSTTINRCWS